MGYVSNVEVWSDLERHRVAHVLDEQIVVPAPPPGDRGIVDAALALSEDPVVAVRRPSQRPAGRPPERRCARLPHLDKPQSSPAAAAELPALGADHRHRAHEAPETGAVRTQHDGHVTGEVDRADGVDRVVDIGGVQPGLTPIGGPIPAPVRSGGCRCGPSGGGPATPWRRTPPRRRR